MRLSDPQRRRLLQIQTDADDCGALPSPDELSQTDRALLRRRLIRIDPEYWEGSGPYIVLTMEGRDTVIKTDKPPKPRREMSPRERARRVLRRP